MTEENDEQREASIVEDTSAEDVSEETASQELESPELESTVEALMSQIRQTVEDTVGVESHLAELEKRLADMRAQLDETERQSAEHFDAWQRSQATFANFRKRMEAEHSTLRETANAGLLTRLLPILDDFKRAFEIMPEEYKDDPWFEGMRMIRQKLQTILGNHNVKAIEIEPGVPFDPKYHEAVLLQEVEGFEEDQIVAEVETGYMMGDRILRPSRVVVAKAPSKAPKTTAEVEAIDEAAEEPDTEETREV